MWNQHGTSYYNNVGGDKNICRARYQQSPVEVYAKFLAIDQVSFHGRRLLRVQLFIEIVACRTPAALVTLSRVAQD